MSAQLPEVIHRLKGTRATRAVDRESGFAGGRPKMPKDLPDAAKAEWKRLCKWLSARGTLTKTDASNMEIYCRIFARWKTACLECDESGPMIETTAIDKGGNSYTIRVVNPCYKLAAQLEHLLARYLASFSATPATREKTRPAAPPPPPKNAIVPGSMEDLERQVAELETAPPEVEIEPETAFEVPDIGRADQEAV